jgi:uncharacterized protein (DUF433 family)
MTADSWRTRVVCDPDVHHGEPCIKGTRIPVAVIVASLADMDRDALIHEYPQLTVEDIQAALRYAAEAAQRTLVA